MLPDGPEEEGVEVDLPLDMVLVIEKSCFIGTIGLGNLRLECEQAFSVGIERMVRIVRKLRGVTAFKSAE